MFAEKSSQLILPGIKPVLLGISLLLILPVGIKAQSDTLASSSVFSHSIRFYQNYISPVRISHCQMYPSCSEYGLQAFASQPPPVALLNTSDRLLRCSHDGKRYPGTYLRGEKRFYDPVSPHVIPDLNRDRTQLSASQKTIPFYALDTLPELRFVNHLIAKQHYREALLEMNRILYFQDTIRSKYFYANYLACLRAVDEPEEGIYAWEHDFPVTIRHEPEVIRELGNIYLDLYQYDRAIDRYTESKTVSSDSIFIDRSNLLLGLGYASMQDWDKSRQSFASLSQSSLYNSYSTRCLDILTLRESYRYKKPALAGTLAIIPGLGYLYAGHPQTALSSLVINGLLVFAGYSSYKNENYALTALLGILSLSFYIGNITGSANSAQRYNTKQDKDVLQKLKSAINY